MARNTSPFPYDVPVSPETVDRNGQKTRSPYFSQELVDWFLEQQTRAEDSPEFLVTVTLIAQDAAIATTPIPMPALAAGVYRVTAYLRITRAATVSSSVQLTITATDGGVSCPQSAAAVTGNTTATVHGATFVVRSDAAQPISYAVAFSTSGATPAQYRLDLRVEAL